MGGIRDQVSALGADIAIVGSGSPAHAKDFQASQRVKLPVYVDPGLKAYGALGFERSVGATLSPRSVAHAVRALFGGHVQGAVKGDPWQQGGVLVVMPDGTVPYAYRSRESGDHPSNAEVLDAVRQAVGPKA